MLMNVDSIYCFECVVNTLLYVYIHQKADTVYDPLRNYCDLSVANHKVIEKRIHSKIWHDEIRRLKKLRFDENIIKEQAGVHAHKEIVRWKNLVGLL